MNSSPPGNLAPRARRLSLPREARFAAREMLAQQCWCWGRDVKRAEGNLLLEYGFARNRAPQNEPGATHYTLHCGGATLRLWGFGFGWSEVGNRSGNESERGVYVGRFEFAPLWFEGAAPDVHAPPHASPCGWEALRAPRTPVERREARRMLGEAMREFARYENWVAAGFGIPYRCACLETWGTKERPAPPEEVAARWGDLAARIERFGASKTHSIANPVGRVCCRATACRGR